IGVSPRVWSEVNPSDWNRQGEIIGRNVGARVVVYQALSRRTRTKNTAQYSQNQHQDTAFQEHKHLHYFEHTPNDSKEGRTLRAKNLGYGIANENHSSCR